MIIEVHGKDQIEQVVKLAREIWTEHYTPVIGREQVSYMLDKFQSTSAISSQIRKGIRYFLMMEEGNPVGYMALEPRQDELFLSKIYVLSSVRGRGLGRKAVDFAAKFAKSRKLGKISLTVNKNNLNTIKAYEKMGFINKGPIVSDIGNGFVMDDYIMEKSI